MKIFKKIIGTVIALIFFQSCIQQMNAQEFGIQLYSLRNQFKKDVSGSLKTISDWGLSNLEGGGTYGLSFEEFDALLTQYNLDVVSVGASFEELRDNPKKVLENAKQFSAKYVMCAWIPHKGNKFDIENVKEAVAVFNKAGKLLKDAGITLAYHAHGYEFRPYKMILCSIIWPITPSISLLRWMFIGYSMAGLILWPYLINIPINSYYFT